MDAQFDWHISFRRIILSTGVFRAEKKGRVPVQKCNLGCLRKHLAIQIRFHNSRDTQTISFFIKQVKKKRKDTEKDGYPFRGRAFQCLLNESN